MPHWHAPDSHSLPWGSPASLRYEQEDEHSYRYACRQRRHVQCAQGCHLYVKCLWLAAPSLLLHLLTHMTASLSSPALRLSAFSVPVNWHYAVSPTEMTASVCEHFKENIPWVRALGAQRHSVYPPLPDPTLHGAHGWQLSRPSCLRCSWATRSGAACIQGCSCWIHKLIPKLSDCVTTHNVTILCKCTKPSPTPNLFLINWDSAVIRYRLNFLFLLLSIWPNLGSYFFLHYHKEIKLHFVFTLCNFFKLKS